MEVSLQDFDLYSTGAVQKKMNMLLKVRKETKQNMTLRTRQRPLLTTLVCWL
jgi:hypothetical protein